MTAKDIEYEIDARVERMATSNSNERDVAAVTMRGVWELALQLAKFNERYAAAHRMPGDYKL
jgi:hypothetical protein